MTRKDNARWARRVGLDTSSKGDQWGIAVTLETTGELPGRYRSKKEPYFVLKIVPNGWWIELFVSRSNETSYVSWNAKNERWHPSRASKKLEPPKSLATLRKWLTAAEEELGVKFRRDRPLIESNVKGGSKAIEMWIKQ